MFSTLEELVYDNLFYKEKSISLQNRFSLRNVIEIKLAEIYSIKTALSFILRALALGYLLPFFLCFTLL